MTREEMHAGHKQSHLYDNGCVMCDLIEELHQFVNGTYPLETLPFWMTEESCVVFLITSIKDQWFGPDRFRGEDIDSYPILPEGIF